MIKNLKSYIAFLIDVSVAFLLFFIFKWWGFLLIFPWIGGWITAGNLIASKKTVTNKDIGRRISILMNYIIKRQNISSTECILCRMCINVCPVKAIK